MSSGISDDSTEIIDNAERRRYEVRVDGEVAGFAAYEPAEGNTVALTHTEVDSAYEGKGVGGRLARGALDDLRATGRSVIPVCPFIKSWIQKHPDYHDVVAP